MKVQLEDLGSTPKHYEFQITPEAECLSDMPARLVGPLDACLDVWIADGVTRVEGSLTAELERECYRCLKTVAESFKVEVEAGFVGSQDESAPEETEVPATDLDTSVLSSDELDLLEMVREQMLLALPDAVLCDETCKGICVDCGQDLNDSECDCSSERIDPRWKGLEDLKRDLKN